MVVALLIGQVALLLLLIVLAFAVFVLYRHFGVMYINSRESRATQGPEIGEKIPALKAWELHAQSPQDVPNQNDEVVLLFTRSGCSPCLDLLREARLFIQQGGRLNVVVGSGAAQAIEYLSLLPPTVEVFADPAGTIFKRYNIDLVPFGISVNNGIVQGKGIPRTLEDLHVLQQSLTDPSIMIAAGPEIENVR